MIADGKTGKGVGMEASWNAFSVVGMGETNPKLPEAVKDAVVLSAGDRYTEPVRRVKDKHGKIDAESGAGPDGPAGGHEIEPALGPLRDDHRQALGSQRHQRRQARRRAAISRV